MNIMYGCLVGTKQTRHILSCINNLPKFFLSGSHDVLIPCRLKTLSPSACPASNLLSPKPFGFSFLNFSLVSQGFGWLLPSPSVLCDSEPEVAEKGLGLDSVRSTALQILSYCGCASSSTRLILNCRRKIVTFLT